MGKKSKRQRPGKQKGSSYREREERIQALFAEALTPGTDSRVEADCLREAFIEMSKDESKKRDPLRSLTFKSYFDAVSKALSLDNYHAVNFPTKEDRKFIKSTSKNTTELSLIRVNATVLWADILDKNLETDGSIQCLQKLIQICQEASKWERQQKFPFEGAKWATVGDFFDGCIENTQASLQSYREYTVPISMSEWNHGELECEEPEYGSPTLFGGDQCLVCGTTYQDLGVGILDCCQLCHLTYYCSEECQKNDWKQHKKVCRKRGEFKVGDVASLADPSPTAEFGDHVRIWCAAPSDPETQNPCWLVASRHGEFGVQNQLFVVEAKHLRRVRPLLWNQSCGKEATAIKEWWSAKQAADTAEAAGTMTSEEAAAYIFAAYARHTVFFNAVRERAALEKQLWESAKDLDPGEAVKLIQSSFDDMEEALAKKEQEVIKMFEHENPNQSEDYETDKQPSDSVESLEEVD